MIKKQFLSIILIVILTLILLNLSSCIVNNIEKTDGNNRIQLWYYISTKGNYENDVLKIVDKAKLYCDENNIQLEVFGYHRDILSPEDYILKRNIAASSGNMIIIDEFKNLSTLPRQNADYTKIDNYKNLLDTYKDRFFIPFGVIYEAKVVENEILKFYGENFSNPIITYTDYLIIKQSIKEKGARFEFNFKEFLQVIDYSMYQNELLFLSEESEIFKNNNNFKNSLKKVVFDVCNDILLYNDGSLKIDYENMKPFFEQSIHDENSDLTLEMGDYANTVNSIISPASFNRYIGKNSSKSFYILPYGRNISPNFFINKKITNEMIYELANYLINEETYVSLETAYSIENDNKALCRYAPVFKMNKSKEILQLNDDLELIDNNWNLQVKEHINLVYEMLIKSEDKSAEIVKAQFSNKDYCMQIRTFIKNIVEVIARIESSENLSLQNFDPNDEMINKMLDEKINDFVVNFTLYNN